MCVGVCVRPFLFQVVDESVAKDRVFFVSAKEVLQLRTQGAQAQISEDNGMPEGWKARLMEFERYLMVLNVLFCNLLECVLSNNIFLCVQV